MLLYRETQVLRFENFLLTVYQECHLPRTELSLTSPRRNSLRLCMGGQGPHPHGPLPGPLLDYAALNSLKLRGGSA